MITHDELCLVAGNWLKRHRNKLRDFDNYFKVHAVTVNNRLMNLPENPDVIGYDTMVQDSVIIEVKVSRQDFKKDYKKPFRANPQMGMGNYRYYCCPEGLIYADELPENWGLLYYADGKISVSVEPTNIPKINEWAEKYMLCYYLRFPKKYAENKI